VVCSEVRSRFGLQSIAALFLYHTKKPLARFLFDANTLIELKIRHRSGYFAQVSITVSRSNNKGQTLIG
jgi:hypothetical protein